MAVMTTAQAWPDITSFELNRGRYRQSVYATGDNAFETERPFRVSFTPARLVTTDPLR
jgi:hypothetical protein